MFIQKAVENLLADRDIKRAAHAELRATCEQVLEEIRYVHCQRKEPNACHRVKPDSCSGGQ